MLVVVDIVLFLKDVDVLAQVNMLGFWRKTARNLPGETGLHILWSVVRSGDYLHRKASMGGTESRTLVTVQWSSGG